MGWRKAKPFPCVVCGKDFDKESKLKRHMKDAHNLEYKYKYRSITKEDTNNAAARKD